MFGMPGGRRESFPVPGPARFYPDFGKFAWDWPGLPQVPQPTNVKL